MNLQLRNLGLGLKTVRIKCGLFHLFFPILASAEVKLRNSRFTSCFRALSDHMWGCFFAIVHSLMVVEAGHMVASYTGIKIVITVPYNFSWTKIFY